jgi:uncharacterized repeat protein (TIGR01451 family)
MKRILLLVSIFLVSNATFSQYTCNQSYNLCGSIGVPFPNTVNAPSPSGGINYGCLGSQPNQTWFNFRVSASGPIVLQLSQNTSTSLPNTPLDVDFILYGPFTDPISACGNLVTSNQVDCSFSTSAIENATVQNAIAGQYYVILITNFSNQSGFITINQSNSSSPGSGSLDCTGFKLISFLDLDLNGLQNNGEPNFPLGQFQYQINNNGMIHNINSPTGIYSLYEQNVSNNYNFNYVVNPIYSSLYSVSTSYNNVNLSTNGNSTLYFPITPLQNYVDLGVNIIPLTSPRAGTTYQNIISYSNLGSQIILSGTVTFVGNSVSTISNVSPAGSVANANGFTFNFSNLMPFETRTIIVSMTVPSIPIVSLGQILTNSVSVSPPTGDVVATNNNESICQQIIAAYDPNDKVESHGPKILLSSFLPNEYLQYTIRFENEGNASAINVRVNDILDPKIDENSVLMVRASHNYSLDRVANNLNFKFDNIQLPVSVANSNIGKGYVTFKAKLKPGFALGDIIPNTANIYFDTNPAITTNTFNTEFVSLLSTSNFSLSNYLLYPNPASSSFQIEINDSTEKLKTIEITDVLGKIVRKIVEPTSNQQTINVDGFSKGIYFVKITLENNLIQTKKLVIE